MSVSRNSPRILNHSRKVKQIPGHEGRVAVRKVILGTARARVEIRGSRSGVQTDDFSPNQIGDVITSTWAALTFL